MKTVKSYKNDVYLTFFSTLGTNMLHIERIYKFRYFFHELLGNRFNIKLIEELYALAKDVPLWTIGDIKKTEKAKKRFAYFLDKQVKLRMRLYEEKLHRIFNVGILGMAYMPEAKGELKEIYDSDVRRNRRIFEEVMKTLGIFDKHEFLLCSDLSLADTFRDYFPGRIFKELKKMKLKFQSDASHETRLELATRFMKLHHFFKKTEEIFRNWY